MNRTAGSIHEHLRRQVEAHGLTLTEFGVLEALFHKGPLTHGDIADRVLLASSSMTYVIDKLEERGLLRRRQSEEDRRVKLAELTPEGETKIEAAFSEHAALLGAVGAVGGRAEAGDPRSVRVDHRRIDAVERGARHGAHGPYRGGLSLCHACSYTPRTLKDGPNRPCPTSRNRTF